MQGLLPGIAEKVYAYHIMLAHKAYSRPDPRVDSARLALLSQDKRDPCPLTILHLCGHRWCQNPDHLTIGTKRWNDEQTSCHRMLQSATSTEEYEAARRVCRHGDRCWTVVYGGEFADRHAWAVE